MAQGFRRGVLPALGLRRGIQLGGGNQNANQPPNQNVNQPPNQNANQPNQPNPVWQQADANRDANERGRLAGNESRVKAAAQEKLKTSLGVVMPLVQRARKVFLTVDGRAREEARNDPNADLTAELQSLAIKLGEHNAKLDEHSRAIRQHNDDRNYEAATESLTAAGETAQTMLSLETTFTEILDEYSQPLPPVLAGEVAEGYVDFEREYAWSEAAIREVLDAEVDTRLLKDLKQDVVTSHNKVLAARSKFDYPAASNALAETNEAVTLYQELSKQWDNFQAEYRANERVFQQLAKLRIKDDKVATQREEVLQLRDTAYDEAAVRGKFVAARDHLGEAVRNATKLLPDNEGAVEVDGLMKIFESLYPQAMQQPELCQVITNDKQQLEEYRKSIDEFCEDGDFSRASNEIAMGISRAQGLLLAGARWNEYQVLRASKAAVIDAATKLAAPQNLDQQKSDALAAVAKADRMVNEDGLFSDGMQQLGEAVGLCEQLLAQGGSPEMLAYYKALDGAKSIFDKVESLQPANPLVLNAQQAFLVVLNAMRAEETNRRFGPALDQCGAAQESAAATLTLLDQYEAYQRDLNAFGKLFNVASGAKAAEVAGVPALQQQLATLRNDAQAALANDLKVARQTLQAAVRVANKIAELHENRQKQDVRHADLGERLGKVAQTYLPPGGADNLLQSGLGDNGDFNTLVTAMRNAETDRSPQNLAALSNAALAYLAPFGQLTDEQREGLDEKVKKRIQIAESALKQAKHVKLANEFAALGTPPWDAATEDRAAALYAKTMFETGDLPMEKASSGVTGAKWIKSMDYEADKGRRDFLFKGADNPGLGAFPDGGEAPREVLADAVGRLLKSATGIDFAVPETRLISVDKSRLTGKNDQGDVLGSSQAAAPCIGDIGDLFEKNPEMLAKIPAKEMQKMAIFDMVALNMDRHQGNFLVSPPSETDGACGLIPIDNGLAFPTLEAFNMRRGKCSTSSVMTRLPQAFEPFDEESLAVIDAIDADELVDGMQSRLTELDQQHPDLGVLEKVPPESQTLTKRSIAFMKKAARELSPAYMTDVLMLHGNELFSCPDDEFDALADRLIAKAKSDAQEFAPLLQMPLEQRETLYTEIWELGWNAAYNAPDFGTSILNWDAWARRNAKLLFEIQRKKQRCPATKEKMDGQIEEITAVAPDEMEKIGRRLPTQTFRGGADDVNTQYQRIKPARLRAQQKLLGEFRRHFRKEAIPDNERDRNRLLRQFEQFQRWGGMSLTKINGRKASRYTFAQQYDFLKAAGEQQDAQAKALLVESNEFQQMIRLLDMAQNAKGEHEYLKDEEPTEIRDQLERYNQFRQLGGLNAFASYGFDGEAIDDRFSYAIDLLKKAAASDGIDPRSV